MGDDQKSNCKRVRLNGARFDGGRLPVDSLVELQKYQEVMRIAAAAEWRQDHPGQEVPPDLTSSVSLTIERIDNGSADVFLAFEQHETYVRYQVEAQHSVDAIIGAAYTDAKLPAIASLSSEEDMEMRNNVAAIGSTLSSGQSMEFYPDGERSSPITITVETRRVAVERLTHVEDFLVSLETQDKSDGIQKFSESLVGRVTALDADKKSYKLALADGTVINGWYRTNDHLLEDFRAVVNSSAEGALTRVTGDLQYKDGNLFRFWDTAIVELVEFDETAWGRRLTEFSALMTGWDGGGAAQISSVALEAAQMLMRAVDNADVERPGVFPTDDGGVLVEWASVSGVRSIEIPDNGGFEMFELRAGQREGEHSTTRDLTVAIAFIQAGKA